MNNIVSQVFLYILVFIFGYAMRDVFSHRDDEEKEREAAEKRRKEEGEFLERNKILDDYYESIVRARNEIAAYEAKVNLRNANLEERAERAERAMCFRGRMRRVGK